MATFVQATFVQVTFDHIRNISAVTDRFWWNLNGSFLGKSRTDSDSNSDICPINICPGDICPYQGNLSCYWPDFDETLKFKGRFLGTSRTDSNCQGTICPCKICPGNICPYQEYLNYYPHNLDQTLTLSRTGGGSNWPTLFFNVCHGQTA